MNILPRTKALTVTLLILAAATAFPARAEQPPPVLRDVRVEGGGGEPRVEIVADQPLTYTAYTMPDLRRAVIDLPLADPGEVKGAIPVNGGMIAKVTVQKKRVNDVPLTRVIIHLQQDAEVAVAADGANRGRIVASLRRAKPLPVKAAPVTAMAAPASPPRTPRPPSPPLPAPQPAPDRTIGIRGVAVTGDGVEIAADAPIDTFRAFPLKDPTRLVIDIHRARSSFSDLPLPKNPWGILSARTGLYPEKLRLVLDCGTSSSPLFQVLKTEKGLRVVFPAGEGKGTSSRGGGK
jgi:hypothetical protein